VQQVKPRRDPAPSRFAYRMQRWWLTPLVRAVLRVGLPAFMVSFAIGFYLSSERTVEAVSLAYIEIRRSVEERPEFMVHTMAIKGASEELAQDIREIVPLDFPISSFDLDLPGMVTLVSSLDAVAEVDLSIRPGGVLQVALIERDAAVIWQSRDALEALDANGHRVGPVAEREDRPDLPFLLGEGADKFVPEALTLLEAADSVLPSLAGLVRMGKRRWDLVQNEGPRIMLPETNPLGALNRVLVAHVSSGQDLLSRDITHVDMRNPLHPTLRLTRDARVELELMRVQARKQHFAQLEN